MGYRVKPFTMSVRNNSTQEFEDIGLLGSDVDRDIADLRSDLNAEASTRQSAINAEASTRQSAINAEASTRQSAINAETAARQTADAAINARIDNIIISQSGDDIAEVVDARVGVDSAVYTSLKTRLDTEQSAINVKFDDTFDSNVIFEKNAYAVNSGNGGTWKSVAFKFYDFTVGDVWHAHCGTVENGVSNLKLSLIACDSSGNFIDGGTTISSTNTDTDYTIPTGTSYIILTLFLSRTSSIGSNVNVIFHDLMILRNGTTKQITLKDSSFPNILITSKEYQYKTQYLSWSSGIYMASSGQVVGDAYYHASLDVNPGEIYHIDAYSWLQVMPCIFVDAMGNTISTYPSAETSSITHQEFEIEVPQNAVKMYCDAILNYYQSGDIGRWDMRACVVKRKVFTDEYQTKKSLIVLSDSWSEKNVSASTNFIDYLVSDGFDTYNNSIGGTGYRRGYDENKAWYQRALGLPSNKGNNVLLFGSFNDMGLTDYELGTIDSIDTSTICGCINKTIENIYTAIPSANIMIASPGTWEWFNRKVTDAQKPEEYCEAIKQISRKNHIPYLDFYGECGLRPWDQTFASIYYKDPSHINDAGHYYYVYPKIRDFLIRNCV